MPFTVDESIEVKGSLAKMRELVPHVQAKGARKIENEEIMERYVMRCEKAIESGKGEHLPKILKTKFDKRKAKGKIKLERRQTVQRNGQKQRCLRHP